MSTHAHAIETDGPVEAILSGLTRSEMNSVATGMATLGNACRSYAEGAKRRATAK